MAAYEIIVIGASAGGAEAAKNLVPQLPTAMKAALSIVLHVSSRKRLPPELLNGAGKMRATHAKDNEPIKPGHTYIAPSEHHLLVVKKGYLTLTQGPEENGYRPSIDALFRSAAATYKNRIIGVILSGSLDDGTAGLIAIKNYNGITIVQDPKEADFPDMPQSALKYAKVDYCSSLAGISQTLITLMKEKPDMKTPVK